jgi:GAF domain-containing protein
MSFEELVDQLAAAARDMSAENVTDTLQKSVHLSVEMIAGCDGAGVSLVRRGRTLDTPAYTDEDVLGSDQLQYELGEGPCLDAVWEEEAVDSPDLAHDDRWPTWAATVVERYGIRSMLCIQLFTTADTLGAMNLYSRTLNGFEADDDRHEALALGAHVSVALRAALEIEHLNAALDRRTVIGQAEGILMERYGLKAERAFELLRRVSSHSNTKLHDVAAELVRTRRTPG